MGFLNFENVENSPLTWTTSSVRGSLQVPPVPPRGPQPRPRLLLPHWRPSQFPPPAQRSPVIRRNILQLEKPWIYLHPESVLWIRIQIGSVLRNFVDQNPYSEYGSGSTQVKIGQIRYKRYKVEDKKFTIQRPNWIFKKSAAIIFLRLKKTFLMNFFSSKDFLVFT